MEKSIAGSAGKKTMARGQAVILAVIIALTVLAWVYTAYAGSADGMGGMVMDMAAADPSMDAAMEERLAAAASGPSLPAFEMFVPMWIAMSVGMMLPTALPMILCMNKICERRKTQGRAYAPSWFFTLGYVVLWALFGVVCWAAAYVLFGLVGSYLQNWRILWLVVGGVFVFAGIYQLSPLKNACLKGCQHPVSFIMRNWREGKGGALLMGMRHGLTCIGCCAALMIVMFPLGMMNLFWMGIFTVLMFAEKNAKFGLLLSRVMGWLLLVAGGIIAAIGVVFLAVG